MIVPGCRRNPWHTKIKTPCEDYSGCCDSNGLEERWRARTERGMQVRRLLQLSRGEIMVSWIREWQRKSSYVVVFQVSFDD